jgi:hypothetical protein
MRVVIENIIELTTRTINAGIEQANYDDITGLLVPQRTFVISDDNNDLSPFRPGGVLNPNQNGWRNLKIDLFDDDDVLIYSGLISNITEIQERGSTVLNINSREGIGNVLQAPIEENDKTTHIFTVDGDHIKGTSILQIKTGTTVIPAVAVMSVDTSLIPSYQVFNPQGSPTVTIELDRSLENDLPDGTPLIISVPVLKTPAEAIRDALQVAFARVDLFDRLDTGAFDQQVAFEQANNYYLWMFIREIDDITLGQHLTNIAELGDILIRYNKDGLVDPVFGLQWNGLNPILKITGDEILYPINKEFDQSRLLYGYNMPWINGDIVEFEQEVLANSDPRLFEWAASKAFNVQSIKGKNVTVNNYLYNNQATAKFYGDRKLDYFSEGRELLKCQLNLFFNDTRFPINLKLFDVFLLDLKLSDTESLVNEPVRVTSYSLNEDEKRYTDVTFEFINKPSPDLPTLP